MAAPIWEAGALYLPGDLVQPKTQPSATTTAITNGGFETGDATGWTLPAGAGVVSGGYSGSYSLQFTGTAGVIYAVHDAVACVPGTGIVAGCMYGQGAAGSGHNTGAVILRWLDASDVLLREDVGNVVTGSSGGGWKASRVAAVAPAGTAKVQIGAKVNRDRSDSSGADLFAWDYAQQALPQGLIYKAVQPAAGHSAETEPVWPTVLGVQVTDNEVIWEAVATSRVTWTAAPLFVSGATEPTWPTDVGERVVDNDSIAWECTTRQVTDANCPNTKVVAILSAKVFAADGDIVRYSATSNPLDWSAEADAGFLATGLQQANANDFAVLAPYRNNLAALNANCFQHWQTDPDPSLMAQLDQLDGVGSSWPRAAVAVSNELIYLTSVGVRTVGIAVGAQNLAAGDIGEPIDDLVQAAIADLTDAADAIGTYYPGKGQYWLSFPTFPVEVCDTPDLDNVHFFAGYGATVNPALGEVEGHTVRVFDTGAVSSENAVINSALAIGADGVPVDLEFTVSGYPNYLYLFVRDSAAYVPGADWPGAVGSNSLNILISVLQNGGADFTDDPLFWDPGSQVNAVDENNDHVSSLGFSEGPNLTNYTGTPFDDVTPWAIRFAAEAENMLRITVEVGGVDCFNATLPMPDFTAQALLFGVDHWNGIENSVTFSEVCHAVDPDAAGSTETFVYQMRQAGRGGHWSRYVHPFAVAEYAQLGDRLYIRHGDEIGVVTDGLLTDSVAGEAVPFTGRVQWNWLDLAGPGDSAALEGFDLEGAGAPAISFGYDQRSTGTFTTPWSFDPDTVTGGIVPYPLQAPSLSVRLDFEAGTAWNLKRVILYTDPSGTGPG